MSFARTPPVFQETCPEMMTAPGMTGVRDPVEHIVEFPKILIICAMIIAAIAGCLSLISPKQHAPATDGVCAALRAAPPGDDAPTPLMKWDDPRYRLLCADSGGGR